MNVLVTRPHEDAAHTAARLARLGHAACVSPVSLILPSGAGPASLRHDAVVATSANAFRLASPELLGSLVDKRIFTVGDHTAAEARGHGIAGLVLDHLLTVARATGARRISLETGTQDVFLTRALKLRGDAEHQLSIMATTDGLTGLCNRRRLDEIFELEWRRAIRSQTPVALLMIDADHFKEYNDNFGHQAGGKPIAA